MKLLAMAVLGVLIALLGTDDVFRPLQSAALGHFDLMLPSATVFNVVGLVVVSIAIGLHYSANESA